MQNILQALEKQVHAQADAIAFDMVNQAQQLNYQQCQQQAMMVGAHLAQQYPAKSRIVLLLDNSLDFFIAFFGCLYANMIPVPLAPPNPHRHRLPAELAKLQWVLSDCTPSAIITHPLIKTLIQQALSAQPQPIDIPTLLTIEEMPCRDTLDTPLLAADDTAFIQYTSGSTGKPKGVMISHRNVITNTQFVVHAVQQTEAVVTWIPVFHDHGIMSALFVPLLLGRPSIMLSPLEFLKQPISWLDAISQAPPCISTCSNFALEWCCDKIQSQDCQSLNLHHWQKASCGSEKNELDTIQRFTKQFSAYGVRDSIFSPCYGLAEHTLCVSGYAMDRAASPTALSLDTQALAQGQVKTASKNQLCTALLNHGPAITNHQIYIVSPDDQTVCDEDTIGEIWCQGDSVALGYWNNPTATTAAFAAYTKDGIGPCLKTGDLGFLHQGDLYISGRMKDVIVIHGNNYAAEEIEWVCAKAHPAIRAGSLCAITDDRSAGENSLLLIEVRPQIRPTISELRQSIQAKLASRIGIHMQMILLLAPNTLSKTTSGKVQRQPNKQRYQHNKITPLVTISHPDQVQLQAEHSVLNEYFTLEEEKPL